MALMTSRVPILAVTLALGGCATARFGTLESVLKGDRPATGAEIQEVRVERAGAPTATTPGMEVHKGDRIVTGSDTRALVTLGAGYELILEPGTDVEILNPSLFMRAGQAFVQTLTKVREYLKIKTEFVVAGVEGTRFVATVQGEDFLVAVVEGHVKVESPTGAWPAKTYGPLEQGRVRGRAAPEKMAPLDPRQVDAIRSRFIRVDSIVRRRVPRVEGLTIDRATALLVEAGLVRGRVRERITGGAPPGSVLDQDPSGDTEARAGERVDLTAGGESSSVPSVVGQPLRSAAATLEVAGLRVGRVAQLLVPNAPEGTVVEQGRRPLSRVAPGTPIDLTVAVAGVRVPDLTRLDRRQVASILTGVGLPLGQISTVETGATEPGRVARQSPSPGTVVARGTPVHVFIASAPAGCKVPSVVGLTEADAKSTLAHARLRLGRVERRGGDAFSATDRIVGQRPESGSSVTCGTGVDVVIQGRIG